MFCFFLSSGSNDQLQTNENGDSLKIDHIQQNDAYDEGLIYKTFKKTFRIILSSWEMMKSTNVLLLKGEESIR